MEELNSLIERYGNIPAMPNIVVKALAIIKDDNSGVKELSNIVSYDQALATKVLKLVNSAYYGFPSQITSISKGLALIGMAQGKNLIIATAMKPMLTTKGGKDLWRHAIRCAMACEFIAKDLNIMDSSEAFALGFLHDIGKVILTVLDTEKCVQIKQQVETLEKDELELEEKYFGVNHVDIGVALARKWQLPVLLINSIKYHHNPLASTMPQISGLVYVADRLTQEYKLDPLLEADVFEKLNLNIDNPLSLQEIIMEKSDALLNQLG